MTKNNTRKSVLFGDFDLIGHTEVFHPQSCTVPSTTDNSTEKFCQVAIIRLSFSYKK